MGLLGWGVVGLGVGGVWLLACGAFLEDLGVCWSLDSVLLVPLGIQIEPSGPRLGPWEPGRMSEDILVGSRVDPRALGLDSELHFGSNLGSQIDQKLDQIFA